MRWPGNVPFVLLFLCPGVLKTSRRLPPKRGTHDDKLRRDVAEPKQSLLETRFRAFGCCRFTAAQLTRPHKTLSLPFQVTASTPAAFCGVPPCEILGWMHSAACTVSYKRAAELPPPLQNIAPALVYHTETHLNSGRDKWRFLPNECWFRNVAFRCATYLSQRFTTLVWRWMWAAAHNCPNSSASPIQALHVNSIQALHVKECWAWNYNV